MRKKRNIITKNKKNEEIKNKTIRAINTENTINTSTDNTINNIHNDNNNGINNVYNKDNSDNINNLEDNNSNKEKLNNNLNNKKSNKKKLTATQIRTRQRTKLFKQVPSKNLDIVIKTILEQLPGLNMQPARIIHYLRLLYISNQSHITALEKIQNDQTLNVRDVIPADDSININPVYYPKIIDSIEIDQILTDKQSRFLNNIRNGIEKNQAFLDAGFSASKIKDILPVISQTSIDKFEHDKYKAYKKLWVEYWKIKKEQSEATGITEDYILSSLKKTADFNIKKIFDDKGNLKNINNLDDETAKQVTEIKISEAKVYYHKTNQTTTTTTTMTIKTGNKDNARKELAKLQQGIFNHVNNKTIDINHKHSGGVLHGNIDVNELSQQQLDKILMIDHNKNDSLQLDSSVYDDDNVIEAEILTD